MEELQNSVPYIVHESSLAREERNAKRLIIALILAIVILFGTNLAWLYAWCQYDYASSETQTVTVDSKEGMANFIGHDGSISYGEDCSENGTD